MDTNPVLMNRLSMDSDIPLYSQLVSIIKRNISAGTLCPGALLPSESELCRAFDVSRSTVRQAIGELESEAKSKAQEKDAQKDALGRAGISSPRFSHCSSCQSLEHVFLPFCAARMKQICSDPYYGSPCPAYRQL